MEKTNTPQYKTQYLNHFKDFDPKKEKEQLGKVNRSFKKNEDDIHELPNLKKPNFNNVTKTMQFLSKDEIKDKIEAAEELEDKKESKIFNWNKFNEHYQEDTRTEWCDGCGELHHNCTCEVPEENEDWEEDTRTEWCDGCGELQRDCTCGDFREEFPTHDDSRDPYDSEYDM